MAPDIKIIEDGFNGLLSEIPALEVNVSSAFSGVKASWDRSLIGEKRLAAAARHSIAVYIVGLVSAAFVKGARSEAEFSVMGRLLKHATEIDGTPTIRHIKREDFEPGGLWFGPTGGPWKREAYSRWNLSLMYSPNMPGGPWTIAIGDTPCLYGDNPVTVETETMELLDGIEASLKSAMLRSSRRSSAFGPKK